MTQPTHSPSSTYGNETLFLVEGTLSELQVARTTANLLAQIKMNSRGKRPCHGFIRCSQRMHDLVVNAATLVLSDGEYIYNFAAVVGEDVVCGAMEHADDFRNGEPVRAVVSKRGDVLYVHAIMQAETRQFYMPYGVYAGKNAYFKSCMRRAKWLASSTSILFLAIFYFLGMYEENENISHMQQLLITLIFVAVFFSAYFSMEVSAYRTFEYNTFYAEAIFKVFEFPQPSNIDLFKVGANFKNTGWRQAWQADSLIPKFNANKD